MPDSFGKRSRQQPIKCWGREGGYMYKDFPCKGERLRIVHNIQKVDTMEYMGGHMPRIYIALGNKQA